MSTQPTVVNHDEIQTAAAEINEYLKARFGDAAPQLVVQKPTEAEASPAKTDATEPKAANPAPEPAEPPNPDKAGPCAEPEEDTGFKQCGDENGAVREVVDGKTVTERYSSRM